MVNENKQPKAYKAVYYDKFTKKMYVRFVGDTVFTKIPYKKDYWVKDPTGKSEWHDLHGVPMIRKPFTDSDVIKNLKANGIAVAESDFKEEFKWIHDTYDNYTLHAEPSEWHWGLYDIEVACPEGAGFPKPEEAAWPINLITVYSSKHKDYFTWSIYPNDVHEDDIIHHHRGFNDELEMLKNWMKWLNQESFDILAGWNTVLFDLPYIINRIKRLRNERNIQAEYECALSPIGKRPIPKDIADRKQKNELGASYEIPGLYHFDYMELWKTFATHPPMASFSLNAVAKLVTGEGKLEYEGTINTVWQDPAKRQQFGRYNVVDVKKNVEIEENAQLMPLIIGYAYDCYVTVDKVYNKVPTTEGYALKFIHDLKIVMNDRADHHVDWWKNEECFKVNQKDGSTYYQNCCWEDDMYEFDDFGVKAGYCYDVPGRWDDCMSFDITSSYPHHVMQFMISPEGKVAHPRPEDIASGKIIASDVAEVGFRNNPNAILPNLVKKVFDERAHYKKLMKEANARGDKAAEALYNNRQGIKKIIINSMYGVCLASSFHLYDIDCARSITRCARVTLRDWLKKYLDQYYVSTAILADVQKHFKLVEIADCEGNVHKFKLNDEITVMRNEEIINIKAKDFNKETDALGIED